MVERTYEVKVNTSVDDSAIQGLEEYIDQLDGADFKVGADSSEIEELEQEIEEVKQQIEEDQEYGFDTTAAELQLTLLEEELKELKAEAESEAEVVLNTESAQGGVTGLTNSLDGLSQLAVGEKLQEWGTAGEAFAQDLNNANITVGQLATQTGMAEEQMRGLIANISNATFPQEEAMMYVKSLDQIGVSASNLGASATGLDRINDAFGLGAPKVNRLGQELSVLGVDMNNVSSAFNALAYANANTVGGMDNYFSFLQRYDAQFKELGLDVDQASIVIAGATQKFGGGRAALSGLSTALKECGGDTRALEESLGLQAGSLEHASEMTGKYSGQLEKMADEEGEHKTILEQICAFVEDVTLKHGELFSMLGSVGGGFGQLIGFGNSLNGTLNLLGSSGGLPGVAQSLGLMGGEAAGAGGLLSGLGSTIAGVATGPIGLIILAIIGIVIALEQFGEAMGWWDSFGGMFEAIADGARRMWDAFTHNEHVIAIVQQLQTAFAGLQEWVNQVMQGVAQAFGWVSEGGESFDFVASAINFLGQVGDAVFPVLSAWLQGQIAVWSVVGQIIGWVILNLVVPYLKFMAAMWSAIFSVLYSVAVGVWNGIVGIITTAINIIRGIINGARAIWTGLTNAWNTLRSVGQSVFSALSSAVSSAGNAWNNFKNTVMGAIQPVIDKINELKSVGGDILHSVGLGGVEYGYSAVTGVSGMGGSNTVNNTFNINIGNVDSTERVDEIKDAFEQILDNEINKQNIVIG
ncbi:MAG: hypothetical protein IKF11_10835 [Methanobrevibacter sp.]|nr:hypothetical protein [Methanobrevibacter sp.]